MIYLLFDAFSQGQRSEFNLIPAGFSREAETGFADISLFKNVYKNVTDF